MSKSILILSDALRYDVARDNMGFLGHLVEYIIPTVTNRAFPLLKKRNS